MEGLLYNTLRVYGLMTGRWRRRWCLGRGKGSGKP